MNRPRRLLTRLTAVGAIAAGLGMGGYGIASAVTSAAPHAATLTFSTSRPATVAPAISFQTLATTKAPAAKTPSTTKCPNMGSRPSTSAVG